jgi:hypothetical protein
LEAGAEGERGPEVDGGGSSETPRRRYTPESPLGATRGTRRRSRFFYEESVDACTIYVLPTKK